MSVAHVVSERTFPVCHCLFSLGAPTIRRDQHVVHSCFVCSAPDILLGISHVSSVLSRSIGLHGLLRKKLHFFYFYICKTDIVLQRKAEEGQSFKGTSFPYFLTPYANTYWYPGHVLVEHAVCWNDSLSHDTAISLKSRLQGIQTSMNTRWTCHPYWFQ
jgi:hypothetical protein